MIYILLVLLVINVFIIHNTKKPGLRVSEKRLHFPKAFAAREVTSLVSDYNDISASLGGRTLVVLRLSFLLWR